jgi:hypothetical protein
MGQQGAAVTEGSKMNGATQPVKGRGKMFAATAMAAALLALLVFAPLASATSDPLASGTTTITLNNGFFNKLKKSKVKVLKVSPGAVKGKTVTLPVLAGELDPTNGQGKVELSGGIKFKAGKKSAAVNTLVLETSTSSLSGKVAGKKMKFAGVKGLTSSRNGFGTNLSISSLKLTGSAAKQLNKKLGFTGKKKAKKSTASSSKAPQPPFKGNQVLGKGTSETQPKTVAVQATGNATLVLDPAALAKLAHVGIPGPFGPTPPTPVSVQLSPVAPTQVTSVSPVTVAFPFSEGGTIAPNATSGVLHTAGGLKLVQNLESVTMEPGNITTLTMGNIWVDLGAKTGTVEVAIENPKNSKANLGQLGRVSIANLNLTGATITSDPTNRTVSIQNATATLQELTAATLNQVFIEGLEKDSEGKPTIFAGQEKFAGGDPLGTFSFSVQTQ